MNINLQYRQPTIEDYNFLLSSWLKSNRTSFDKVSDEVYFCDYKAVVRRLLASKDCILAVDPEDFSSILGYIIYENQTVYYIYVKHSVRNFGVAKSLLKQANITKGFITTTQTPASIKILVNHNGFFKYNPFLLYI